jgi:hypothetical protein
MALSHSKVMASLFGTLLALGSSTASAGERGEPVVALGEVHASTPSGEFSAPLRAALARALARAELGSAREKFVLSATLVRLDAEQVGRGARASAAVSLVLRRARQQTLHAVLSGHATAEESEASVTVTREDALRAAVESAVRRLPEALR